jgi:hypothetical protein
MDVMYALEVLIYTEADADVLKAAWHSLTAIAHVRPERAIAIIQWIVNRNDSDSVKRVAEEGIQRIVSKG